MSEEYEQLGSVLSKIADRTVRGTISWHQANPTTFMWVNENTEQVAVIQKAARGTRATSFSADYLFEVRSTRTSPPTVVVSLSSKEKPDLEYELELVYRAASESVDRTAAKIISGLLKD